jgi:ATP-binding cassette, subfamily B, bacterial PglK
MSTINTIRFKALKTAIRLLTARERVGALAVVGIMMVGGLLESAVVGLTLPLVYVIVDPSRFEATRLAGYSRALFGVVRIGDIFPFLAGGLILLLMASSAVSALASYYSERQGAACRNRLSRELLERCIRAPYLWIVSQNGAVLARRIHDDVRGWRRDYIQGLLMLVQASFMVLFPSIVAIAISPLQGFLAIMIAGAIAALAVLAVRPQLAKVSAQGLAAYDATAKALLQVISGVREVKVSTRSEFFVDMVDRAHQALTTLGERTRILANVPANVIRLLGQIGFVGTALLLWVLGYPGADIAAQMGLIGVVVSRVVPALNSLVGQLAILTRAAPQVLGLERFLGDIEQATVEYGRVHGRGVAKVGYWSTLSLAQVSVRYPGATAWSVAGVELTFERGKSYGLVGRSGAGKSTLVNLVLGLIEPTRGSVRIDEIPLTDIAPESWHHRIGYVPQDVFVFDTTLRDNVTFGAHADERRVWDVLGQAGLHDFVAGLASGLNTQVGERGRRLSGGQAQRLAIARALYKRPEILLLDEATAALDSVTEGEIQASLETLQGDVMTLIVAHRVTTLRNCDRIFVLDNGRIADCGSYGDLLARSPQFQALAAAASEPTSEKIMAAVAPA